MSIGPPPSTDFEVDVTDEQVAFFREHGYLAVERLTTDEEVEWLRAAYDAFEAAPRSGFPDQLFDVARPYGSTEEPELGQLLFPEQRIDGRPRHGDVPQRPAHRRQAPRRPGGDRRALGPPDLQATEGRRGDAVAPGRGVLERRPRRTTRSVRGRRSTTPTSTTAACGSCPARTGATCSPTATSATTRPCTSSSSPTTSTCRPRCRSRCRAGGTSFHHPRTIHGARPNSTDRTPAGVGQRVPARADHARGAG